MAQPEDFLQPDELARLPEITAQLAELKRKSKALVHERRLILERGRRRQEAVHFQAVRAKHQAEMNALRAEWRASR
jgi:hypothetical protein